MHRSLSTVIVCALTLGAVPLSLGQAPQGGTEVLLGALASGRAFVGQLEPEKGYLYLFHARLPDGEPVKPPVVAYAQYPPPRWRLAHGHLWTVSSFSTPIDTKFIHDRLYRLDLAALLKGKLRFDPGKDRDYVQEFVQGGGDPLHSARLVARFMMSYQPQVYYDYLPVSAEEVLLFLLTDVSVRAREGQGSRNLQEFVLSYPEDMNRAPQWSLGVWRYRAAWGRLAPDSDHEGWVKGEWSFVELLPVAFKEPFHVYAKGAAYFFVTTSGRVFVAIKEGQGQRQVKPLWVDGKQPVRAVIDDVERKQAFAFGHAADSARGFFFELDGQLRVRHFEPGRLKPAQIEAPLKTVLEYAQVLGQETKGDK